MLVWGNRKNSAREERAKETKIKGKGRVPIPRDADACS